MRSPLLRALGALLLLPVALPAVVPAPRPFALPPIPSAPEGIDAPGSPALASRLTGRVRIAVEPVAGELAGLIGPLAPAGAGTPRALADRFLAEDLGLPVGPELALARTARTPGASHLTYLHRVAGVRIRGEELCVHLRPDGSVYAVEGSFHPARPLAGPASLTADAAMGAARARLGDPRLAAPAAAEAVWFPTGEALVPAFEVRLATADPPADLALLIDGRDGSLIGGEDRLLHLDREDPPLAEGRGSIYARHPLLGEPVAAPLPRLIAGQAGLAGVTATILNEDAPPAQSSTLDFDYPPDDSHFDEVMAYHHLDRMHRYFIGLGYDRRKLPIPATVHYGDKYDNAFFSPFRDVLAFGDGDALNDLAREDDVMYHEYTHAAVQKVVLLFGYEAGGMNEGYADYFACSLTDQPLVGAWVAAKSGKPFLRTMESSAHYPEDFANEPHKDGQIFGGALWDLRKAIGAEATDRIVFTSWYHIGSPPSFRRGFSAALAADELLYQGAHGAAITAAFEGRGLGLPPAGDRPRIRLARLFARAERP